LQASGRCSYLSPGDGDDHVVNVWQELRNCSVQIPRSVKSGMCCKLFATVTTCMTWSTI